MTGSAVAPAVATCCAGASSSSSVRVNDSPSSASAGSVGSPSTGTTASPSAGARPWRRPPRPAWCGAGLAVFLRRGLLAGAAALSAAWPRGGCLLGRGAFLGYGGGALAAVLRRPSPAFLAAAFFGAPPPTSWWWRASPRSPRRPPSRVGSRTLGLDHHAHSFVAEAAEHRLHPGRRDARVLENGPDVARGDVPPGLSLLEQTLDCRISELRRERANRVRHVLPLVVPRARSSPGMLQVGGGIACRGAAPPRSGLSWRRNATL